MWWIRFEAVAWGTREGASFGASLWALHFLPFESEVFGALVGLQGACPHFDQFCGNYLVSTVAFYFCKLLVYYRYVLYSTSSRKKYAAYDLLTIYSEYFTASQNFARISSKLPQKHQKGINFAPTMSVICSLWHGCVTAQQMVWRKEQLFFGSPNSILFPVELLWETECYLANTKLKQLRVRLWTIFWASSFLGAPQNLAGYNLKSNPPHVS